MYTRNDTYAHKATATVYIRVIFRPFSDQINNISDRHSKETNRKRESGKNNKQKLIFSSVAAIHPKDEIVCKRKKITSFTLCF